jgi:geranylgeranyl pyrophosphate synthase
MNHISEFFSSSKACEEILSLNNTPHLQGLFDQALMTPLNHFFKTPGKNIRPAFVELGYRLSFPEDPGELTSKVKDQLSKASSIVELIHGGSLIVDDIQDGSTVRRNAPTLHLEYGMPLALNAGNWLYFWALGQVKDLDLSTESTGILFHDLLNLMTRAHFGQALDIGSRIDEVPQDKVKETCLASIELKTGTLMLLAIRLGSAIAGQISSPPDLGLLGVQLGLLLQMFDDAGNLLQEKTSLRTKRYEDLYQRRPTWVWAHASQMDQIEYQEFIRGVHELPDETRLAQWLQRNDFKTSLLNGVFSQLHENLCFWESEWKVNHQTSLGIVIKICQKLEKSYVAKT